MATVLAHGPTKASVRLADGVQCDLRGVEDAQFPFALHYFTGSKAHNIAMRRRALARGLTLNEYALAGPDGPVAVPDRGRPLRRARAGRDPPRAARGRRRDRGRRERATARRWSTLDDLTGTFHCHTDWSDGGATLDEMAEAARAPGLQYLGIADHSRSARYAGGLTIERVREQWAAIDALNQKFGGEFRLFKGTECDILPDGSLDYPDEVLDGLRLRRGQRPFALRHAARRR